MLSYLSCLDIARGERGPRGRFRIGFLIVACLRGSKVVVPRGKASIVISFDVRPLFGAEVWKVTLYDIFPVFAGTLGNGVLELMFPPRFLERFCLGEV